MEPLPAPEQASYRSDPRIGRVQASLEPLRGTLLEKMHWVNADEPEECPWGYYDCTGLLGRGCWAVMPEWSDWVTQHDLTATFQEYRHLLKILLWKNPPPPNGFLVLKSPTTTAQIHQFARVFPEARYLFTHRDPIVPSFRLAPSWMPSVNPLPLLPGDVLDQARLIVAMRELGLSLDEIAGLIAARDWTRAGRPSRAGLGSRDDAPAPDRRAKRRP